jgi:hypothetical protein
MESDSWGNIGGSRAMDGSNNRRAAGLLRLWQLSRSLVDLGRGSGVSIRLFLSFFGGRGIVVMGVLGLGSMVVVVVVVVVEGPSPTMIRLFLIFLLSSSAFLSFCFFLCLFCLIHSSWDSSDVEANPSKRRGACFVMEDNNERILEISFW